MTHREIAQTLYDLKESIILIYAFNSTGKTRLSVEYKNLTKEANGGEHAGVYFNAYSEDLFFWDNDEENHNINVRLKVVWSNLSQFHSYFIETPDLIGKQLELYSPNYRFKLNPYKNKAGNYELEKGIESIIFYYDDNETPVKISRGEERIFTWCFFLALMELEGWTDKQSAHILIDDPVSSLDDYNIFTTAHSIMKLIKANHPKKRIILTTHHIGLFSILATWIGREDKLDLFTTRCILSNQDGVLKLKGSNADVFLYHLHLLQLLRDASQEQLHKYHMVLLRQVLEYINSFLGARKFGKVLSDIGVKDVDDKVDIINSSSHMEAYQAQIKEMSPGEETVFRDVLEKLLVYYKFKLHKTN